ncbi:MAG: tetratricopeptide repeat protein [Phycisphaerales bacterium]|nr:MAG: tetratricopeptide repeat protein [Phycisphaerales bacterium]
MKRTFMRQFRPYLVVFASVIVAAAPRTACAVRHLKIGDSMPTFFLPRADSVSGMYTYEGLSGQPAVMIFFRPNHKFSLDALRDLEQVAREIGSHRFKLVAIDAKLSTAQDVRASFADETISFPVLLDPSRILYEKVGLVVCPTTLILDGEGKLRFVVASHPRLFLQTVRAQLRFLLGEIDEQTMNREIDSGAQKIEPDLIAAWRSYNRGLQLQEEGRTKEAASVFEKTIAKYPSLVEARCELGFLKLEVGEPRPALDQFRAALSHRPAFGRAQLGLAIILSRTGDQEQAEDILLSILEDRSLAARAQCELGRIYLDRGDRDKAIRFFQDALAAIFPEPPVSNWNMTIQEQKESPQ